MGTQSTFTQLSPSVHTLGNGLTVVMEVLPHVHSATIGVWINTGSANETDTQPGISHFLEHLLFKGTEKRTTRELMDAIEGKGGQVNAFTSREQTCVYVKCLDRHLPTSIEVLGDIIKNCTFHDMEKERNVILEEIATGIDTPDEHVHDVLTGKLWPDHPIGRPIAGSSQSVSDTTFDDVRAYKDRWYRPEHMFISVVGKFDEEVVLQQLREEFESIEPGRQSDTLSVPKFSAGIETVDREIAQNHIVFGFPGVPVTDERRYGYDLLTSTLGGGSTSRLFERVREQEGLAYAVYSFGSSFVNTGMLGTYAAVAPENLEKTVHLCFEEMRKLAAEPMDTEELESNREQMKGGLVIALESTFNRMARMARSLICYGRVMSVDEILDAVDAVTAEDVQRYAAEAFTPENCALAVLGPTNGKTLSLG